MVTFAQAQERAEEWVNGDVPAYQHREVRVREFELGFVVWAEDRAEGPRSDGGPQRLVIARDSGEATLWPALPVGEVIRRYEEEYGRAAAATDAATGAAGAGRPEPDVVPADSAGVVAGGGGQAGDSGSAGGLRGTGCLRVAVRLRLRPRLPRCPWPLRVGVLWTRCRLWGPRRGPGPIRPVWTRARTVPCRCRRPCSRRSWVTRTAMTFRVPGTPSTAVRGLRGTGIRRGRVGRRTGTAGAPGAPSPSGRALAPNAGEIADAATSKAPPPRGARGASAPPPPGAPGTPGARPGVAPPSPPPGPGACGWVRADAVRVGAGA